jgi:hypothetical protein
MQVAPTLVPPHIKAKASGLMTVTFQSACFLALVSNVFSKPIPCAQRLKACTDLQSAGI